MLLDKTFSAINLYSNEIIQNYVYSIIERECMMNQNTAKSELQCIASELLEEELNEELSEKENETPACGALSEFDVERILKENTIETTRLCN